MDEGYDNFKGKGMGRLHGGFTTSGDILTVKRMSSATRTRHICKWVLSIAVRSLSWGDVTQTGTEEFCLATAAEEYVARNMGREASASDLFAAINLDRGQLNLGKKPVSCLSVISQPRSWASGQVSSMLTCC